MSLIPVQQKQHAHETAIELLNRFIEQNKGVVVDDDLIDGLITMAMLCIAEKLDAPRPVKSLLNQNLVCANYGLHMSRIAKEKLESLATKFTKMYARKN